MSWPGHPTAEQGATEAPLTGVRVLNLSDHPSAMVAAHVFAEWGADVARVDSDESRFEVPGPRFRLVPDIELQESLAAVLGTGVRALTANDVDAELTSADIVLTGSRAVADRILEQNPEAVAVALTEFPESGRYSGWTGSEMIHQALAGAMYVTGSAEHPPLYGLGHRAYYAAGWTTVIGAMGALLARDTIAGGQRVEVSVYEACAAMGQNLVSQYSYTGTWPTRARYDGMVTTIRCKDGWLVLFAYLHWPAMCEAFEVMHLIDDPRFTTIEGRSENWAELAELLQAAAVNLEVDRVVHVAQAGKVSASRMCTVADVLNDPYHQDRLWVVRDSADGAVRALDSGIHFQPLADPGALPETGDRS